MYNMNISIFGYKLNLQILNLIGIIYLILVAHTLCGCSNYTLMEGLDMMNSATTGSTTGATDPSGNMTKNATALPVAGGDIVSGNVKNGASKANGKVTESFVGANTNYGQSSPYDLSSDVMVNTSSWSQPNLTVVPGKPLSDGVKKFLARKQQPLPLPDGQLDFLANVQFKPECCPNTYSNSQGCACLTSKDYNYLITRGGNNVPYSEY